MSHKINNRRNWCLEHRFINLKSYGKKGYFERQGGQRGKGRPGIYE